MFLIVVVSTNSCTAVDFLDQYSLRNEIELQPIEIASLNKANSNKNAISVIDVSTITANDVHALKQVDTTLFVWIEHGLFDIKFKRTILYTGKCDISHGWLCKRIN